MDPIRAVLRYQPCATGLSWLRAQDGTTPQEVWDACPRGDWMIWMFRELQARKFGNSNPRAYVTTYGRYDYEHPVPEWITDLVRKVVPADQAYFLKHHIWWNGDLTAYELTTEYTREIADALRAAHPSCPNIELE